MTNYEKIKSMSVYEMAMFLKTISNCEDNLCNECPLEGCANVKGIAKWLESEVPTNYCTDKQNKLRHCEDCHEECEADGQT